jgi:acetyl-CoA carboxylase carboxyltransferase component
MGSQEKMSRFASLQGQAQQKESVAAGRLRMLLDPDSFVQLDSLVESAPANAVLNRPPVPGDGVLTGYGMIDGRLVYVAAQDRNVYLGSIGSRHAAKIAKVIRLAETCGAPFIGLYDSGGIRLEEGLAAVEAVGDVLAQLTEATGRIPLVAAVFGPCTGSAAMLAAASDVVILEENEAVLSVNGPGVTAAVENKEYRKGLVGSAADHALSGLATLVVAGETALIRRIRQILSYLPDTAEGFQFAMPTEDDPNRCEPELDTWAESLDAGLDVHAVCRAILDRDSLLELMPACAPELLAGLGCLNGRVVGVLATGGQRLTAAMSRKAAWLTALCDRLSLPQINLVHCPGFEISAAAEAGGLARHAARLFQPSRLSRRLKLAVITGQAFGPAWLGLASKAGGADLVLAWPTAEIAALPPDTAAHILYRQEIAAAADPQQARQEWTDQYADAVAGSFAVAATGLIDEVIRPAATRPRLISALETLSASHSLI